LVARPETKLCAIFVCSSSKHDNSIAHRWGDVLENALEENVRQNVAALKNASPILNAAVDEKRVAIVGGVDWLATVHVDFIV
jgi:carbonic anhydrase